MTLPELRPIHTALAGLRKRLRAVWALRGLALLVTAATLVVLVSFALDWLLDLPLVVRVVHLCAVVVGLAILAGWALSPLRRRLRDQDLAQLLEDTVPELEDRVASALDFERRLHAPDERESCEMMRIVVRDAADAAAKLRPATLVDARTANRAALFAGGAVAVTVLVAALAPTAFGTWVRRGVLLQDLAWPRRTTVLVVGFESGTKVVTRGDDLRVVAAVEGVRPRELTLHYEALEVPADGDGDVAVVTETDTRRMFPLAGKDDETGRYAFDFRGVSTSFRFWVTGGDDDDRDPVYEVRALVPPRIVSIVAHVKYPEYSELPATTFDQAAFEVLVGSQVRLELAANMPLARARMLPEDAEAVDLELTGNSDRIVLDLLVQSDEQFHLELRGGEGQVNQLQDDRFLIRAIADRSPTVRVLHPLARIYRTPDGVVPVKAIVDDDYGIATSTLEVTQDGRPLRAEQLWPPGPDAPKQKRLDLYRPLELAALRPGDDRQIVPGDVLEVMLRALDNAQNETEAPEVTVEVLSREDLERRLSQRQVGLRDQLLQLRSHQRRTLDGIRRLRRDVDATGANAGELDRGRDLQVDQGRVTNELARFLSGTHRVFDAYVLNRLGSVPTVDRLLPLYHEALAEPAEGADGVFPRALYTEIVAQKRDRRLYDPEVLGVLLDIMDLGDQAVLDLSPAVYDALRAWSGDDAPRPELLAEAERRAVELEAKLTELDRRMDSWSDLNEMIELARQIKTRQEDIARPRDPGTGRPTERR